MIETTIAILCDYIRVSSIIRDNEDATRYEKNGVELQGLVEKAGALTMNISNDMEKVVEDQIARTNEISAQRLHNDLLHACGFVETLINRMDPYLNVRPQPASLLASLPPRNRLQLGRLPRRRGQLRFSSRTFPTIGILLSIRRTPESTTFSTVRSARRILM